jgi:hypothetical protein
MAKIRKRGKTVTIKFEDKRESSNFLRAVGFMAIPALQDRQAVEHNVQRTECPECCSPLPEHFAGCSKFPA